MQMPFPAQCPFPASLFFINHQDGHWCHILEIKLYCWDGSTKGNDRSGRWSWCGQELHWLAQEDDWRARESAILALGAISEGCANGLLGHLTEMVHIMLPMLLDARPLVRSISCWALSRYSYWIVQASVELNSQGKQQFDTVVAVRSSLTLPAGPHGAQPGCLYWLRGAHTSLVVPPQLLPGNMRLG